MYTYDRPKGRRHIVAKLLQLLQDMIYHHRITPLLRDRGSVGMRLGVEGADLREEHVVQSLCDDTVQ
jgi:hypothetical protein